MSDPVLITALALIYSKKDTNTDSGCNFVYTTWGVYYSTIYRQVKLYKSHIRDFLFLHSCAVSACGLHYEPLQTRANDNICTMQSLVGSTFVVTQCNIDPTMDCIGQSKMCKSTVW